MQLQTMRDLLRGWLQDKIPSGGVDTERKWTNLNLRTFLNLGLRDAEKDILTVDPEAFKCTYIADIVVPAAGVDALYAWPAGTWGVIEVALGDGVNYAPLRRTSLAGARKGYTGFIPYSKAHFMLSQSPSTAVAAGLRVIVAPTLVMAVDTDECPIPPAHETLVLKRAQKYALMDVGEPTDKIDAEIAALREDIPKYYFSATEPSFLTPVGFDDSDYGIS